MATTTTRTIKLLLTWVATFLLELLPVLLSLVPDLHQYLLHRDQDLKMLNLQNQS